MRYAGEIAPGEIAEMRGTALRIVQQTERFARRMQGKLRGPCQLGIVRAAECHFPLILGAAAGLPRHRERRVGTHGKVSRRRGAAKQCEQDRGGQARHDPIATAPPPCPLGVPDPLRMDRFATQETVQVVGERRGGCIAPRGLLFQALDADRLQIARHVAPEASRSGRIVMYDLLRDHRGATAKRQFAGQHLEQHHTQRIDVARARALMCGTAGLFRRHVGDRTEHLASERQCRGGVPFGQAEVQQMRLIERVHHDVCRLQISVYDAGAMGMIQSHGNRRARRAHRA